MIRKRTCEVPAEHHSNDVIKVHYGTPQATWLCGYHSLDVDRALRLIREEKDRG